MKARYYNEWKMGEECTRSKKDPDQWATVKLLTYQRGSPGQVSIAFLLSLLTLPSSSPLTQKLLCLLYQSPPQLPTVISLTMPQREAEDNALSNNVGAACPPAALNTPSKHDYYNQRYKELDEKRGCTSNYEESTEIQRDRMERLWQE